MSKPSVTTPKAKRPPAQAVHHSLAPSESAKAAGSPPATKPKLTPVQQRNRTRAKVFARLEELTQPVPFVGQVIDVDLRRLPDVESFTEWLNHTFTTAELEAAKWFKDGKPTALLKSLERGFLFLRNDAEKLVDILTDRGTLTGSSPSRAWISQGMRSKTWTQGSAFLVTELTDAVLLRNLKFPVVFSNKMKDNPLGELAAIHQGLQSELADPSPAIDFQLCLPTTSITKPNSQAQKEAIESLRAVQKGNIKLADISIIRIDQAACVQCCSQGIAAAAAFEPAAFGAANDS